MSARRLIAAAALAGLSAAASAATFGLHIGSHHFPDKAYQNNTNPGLYVKLENGFTGGVYRNTLGRTSAYLGHFSEWGPVGLLLGATTGYQLRDGYGVSNGYLTPMVSPSVRLPELLGVTPRISIVPSIGTTSTVLHLSVEVEF